MEDEETSLHKSLEEYNEQIKQVDELITVGGDVVGDDLIELRSQLIQLKKLTEESLVNIKKSKLLRLLEEDNTEKKEQGTHTDHHEADKDAKASDTCQVTGMKCRAPLVQPWGATQYLNAYVHSVQPAEGKDEEDQVIVMFTNPTHLPIKPCSHFLEGKCWYGDDCRCSHGQATPISHLQPYIEPDLSKISVGTSCMAEYNDGLWYDATVLSIHDDLYFVQFDAYNETSLLPAEAIFPLDSSDNSSDDSMSGMSDEETMETRHGAAAPSADADWVVGGATRPLGDWERFTTGFGSRIMAKMGYVLGKGLGKDSEGRVEPVEVVVLPPGRSLDMCAELREKGRLKKGVPSKKKRSRTQKSNTGKGADAEEKETLVFDFINSLGKMHGPKTGDQSKQVNTNSATDTRSINLKLFRNQEERKATQKRLLSLEQSLQRNAGSAIGDQVKFKIEAAKQDLQRLDTQERNLQRQLQKNNSHRKLTVF